MSSTLTLNPPVADHYASTGNYLDVEVRRIMTPGVVTISETPARKPPT